MNNYESKQAAKKDFYADKAERLQDEANRLHENDNQLMSMFSNGQPVLVGHHSEKRQRTALKKSDQHMHKVIELNKKAEYYRKKSLIVNNAISSDDSDAVQKLKAKLEKLEALQIKMKRINSEFRKGGVDAITDASEAAKQRFKAAMLVDPYLKMPIESYMLTNNSAEIRRVKKRIEELQAKAQEVPRDTIEGDGYTVTENQEDNRICVEFDLTPTRDARTILKQHGLKWSPSRSAWVRMLNDSGRSAVECALIAVEPLLLKR